MFARKERGPFGLTPGLRTPQSPATPRQGGDRTPSTSRGSRHHQGTSSAVIHSPHATSCRTCSLFPSNGPAIDRADETARNTRTCRCVAQLGSPFCPTLAQLLQNRRPRCYFVADERLSALTRPSSEVSEPTVRGLGGGEQRPRHHPTVVLNRRGRGEVLIRDGPRRGSSATRMPISRCFALARAPFPSSACKPRMGNGEPLLHARVCVPSASCSVAPSS
jgi:hypothetical protein